MLVNPYEMNIFENICDINQQRQKASKSHHLICSLDIGTFFFLCVKYDVQWIQLCSEGISHFFLDLMLLYIYSKGTDIFRDGLIAAISCAI